MFDNTVRPRTAHGRTRIGPRVRPEEFPDICHIPPVNAIIQTINAQAGLSEGPPRVVRSAIERDVTVIAGDQHLLSASLYPNKQRN